ncbi:hypothetical protein Nepgr_030044 [Nepenthes gracilis]|uniref:Uncharacterized protein n=1 Tax=Nepenthes gracilis TaxID=150966 RepID=A0AAD3Y664_NEPGR|nr:hypothetical protein Nepgr_030044 [Nepenthes gracilis]
MKTTAEAHQQDQISFQEIQVQTSSAIIRLAFQIQANFSTEGFTTSPASEAALNQCATNITHHQQQEQPMLFIGYCYPTSAHGGALHNRYQMNIPLQKPIR